MEWDAASSVNTVGSYVRAMFGHSKAREIASEEELVRRTNKYGKMLLTMQSRVTDRMSNDHRTVLQYAWIKHRIVGFAELEPCLQKHQIDAKYVEELRTFLETQNLVHTVITNVHDESWVITNYFWEEVFGVDAKEALQSTILDFLEADDPGVIADAASNPIFQKSLMQHFAGGDSKEQRNWHTLSKLKGNMNLLNLCCMNNYSECVDLLLSEHTPETAKQPWLTLAEPMLSVDKYNNTAFHAAAWNGSPECLEHLVAYAARYSIPVDKLLDVKKKTCLQIARERGNHRCVEILAPLFGLEVEKGLQDGSRNEQEAILFLDFEKLPEETNDLDAQSIPLAPPKELLEWIEFDGLSWLIHEDVKSRTYADDDVWIQIPKGNELVKVESMARDCVWDVKMEAQSLRERVQNCGFSYLRIFVAARRRAPMPKEGSAELLLENLQNVLARVPQGRQVSQVTLIGFAFVPSPEAKALHDIFDLLLKCSTISFRKCSCQASTLLHVLQAVRHALCYKAYAWTGLFVLPSCPAVESPELASEFREEMPLFLDALRGSTLGHLSRSGCKTCRIPAGPMDEADRFWTGLVESSLDINRFVGMMKSRRKNPNVDDRPDRIPAFFLHGVLYIWRFLYKPANVVEAKGTDMAGALLASTDIYVREWLKNVTILLQPSSGIGLEQQRELLGLTEPEFAEMLKHLDFAIWALLRMHRLLPFALDFVRELVPRPVLGKLMKTTEYCQRHKWPLM